MNISMRKRIKTFVDDSVEHIQILRARYHEIQKYREPRRAAIHSGISLTEEQKASIDKLFLENYGEKIPHVWHKHFTAFTGRFDVNYFPELLFIPEFERFMNMNVHYRNVFEDKTILTMLAGNTGVNIKTPHIYVSCVNGQCRDGEHLFIPRSQAIQIVSGLDQGFAKPAINSNSGRGCMKFSMVNGRDRTTGKTAEEILGMMGDNFVVQECIRCHSSIAEVYAGSVNTFRIITYCWRGRIEHMPIILRLGQKGSYLDNAHAGGMFIAVSDEGVMHQTAVTEFRDTFTRHPDTGMVFEGHQIEHVPRVIEAAKRMHMAIPQVGCVNWDFTIDETGAPVLIEANLRAGSIWLSEMAHGCGGFGERTPEVLRWLRLCKSVPKSERAKYAYGKME